MIRCLPTFASLLLAGLCGLSNGCSKPIEQGRYETIILHTMAMEGDSKPLVTPVVLEKCDGSGYITHGDGHRTPCPGCENCRKQSAITPLHERSPLCECEECRCENCLCSTVPETPRVKPAVLSKAIDPNADTDWEPSTFMLCEGDQCRQVRAPVRQYNGKLWGWYGGKMYVIANGRATPHRSTTGGSCSDGGCSDGSCSTSVSGGGGGCASCGAGRFGRRR